MTATHFYDNHLFDPKVRDGLPLRGVFGTTRTVPSLVSDPGADSQKLPLIYTLLGMSLMSGLSWAGIVFLFSRFL